MTISLRQAIDVLNSSPETQEKCGQKEEALALVPDILRALRSIVGVLDLLGSDGIKLLRRDKRLKIFAAVMEEISVPDPAGAPVDESPALMFEIFASPLLKSEKAMRRFANAMKKEGKNVLIALEGQEVTFSSKGFRLSFPARFSQEGARPAPFHFLPALLNGIKADEWIQCFVRADQYQINEFCWKAPKPR